MTDSSGSRAELVDAVGLCLAVAAAERVTSIVPLFFGHLAGLANTDAFDIKEGVYLSWRRVNGRPGSDALEREVVRRLPGARRVVEECGVRGASAVLPALDAVSALVGNAVSVQDRFQRAFRAGVAVAVEYDLLGVRPPAGHSTWLAYELHGQAVLCATLPVTARELTRELAFALEECSGMEAMNYGNAMEELLRTG
ncbi:hypothetical protein [Longispora urticae]